MNELPSITGQELARSLYGLATRLFPICRSLTGEGVRKTISLLQQELPELRTFEVPSGTKCFDWNVPKEWNIQDAFLEGPEGERIVSFQENNLHVVGYSIPIDKVFSLDELQPHLYSLPSQPDAIPYVTSYYREHWGFCLSEERRRQLKPGKYRAVIKSQLSEGSLTYGELILRGASSREVLLSTYVCHPSMGNNEISGPVVATYLAKWLKEQPSLALTYRIVFVPETIGSIVYLSRHLEEMRENTIAGFNITCVGDERTYSYLPSRAETSLSDRVALHVLGHLSPGFQRYSYLDRGSDERQYCSPGVDLPIATIMRSKYGDYPEYHTSLDNLDFISPQGLFGGYEALRMSLWCLERNVTYRATVCGEPQLGKRGLYPTVSSKGSAKSVENMMNLLAYADGTHDLLAIAQKIGAPFWELVPIADRLVQENLLRKV